MTTPVSTINTDPIWSKNVYILAKPDRLIEFFPHRKQTLEERMNAVARFIIYSSLLVSAYKRSWYYLIAIPIGLLVLNLIYSTEEVTKETKETKQPKSILKTKPTLNNPMMNVSFADYEKEESPKYYEDTETSEELRKEINEKLSFNLYNSVDDVFEKANGNRQFYTMPSTTIPNDQEKFLKFLYGDMNKTSCKSDSLQCKPLEDPRHKTPGI